MNNVNNMRLILQAFSAEAATDPRALTAERMIGDGNDESQAVRRRLTWLISRESEPLAPEMMINPAGTDTPCGGSSADHLWPGDDPSSPGGELLESHEVSYALIHHESIAWRSFKDEANAANEPIITDKKVDQGSYWNEQQWTGQVGWRDGRVDWEEDVQVPVRFRDDRPREGYHLFHPPPDAPPQNFMVNP